MSFDSDDMQAALMHELKNNLGQLAITLDGMAFGSPEHDAKLDSARLLCQRSMERLQLALFLYKAERQELHPVIDAHSPLDLLRELDDNARSLASDRLTVETLVDERVPEIWFFDRTLVEMALLNAIHNALAYAVSRIRIEAEVVDGCLAFTVHDDSSGYPERIVAAAGEPVASHGMGTGLGLRFARMIAELHRNHGRSGALHLCNDSGAVFRLLLP